MRILVAVKKEGWDAEVSNRFGRAAGFSVYDDTTGKLAWISNEENKQSEHGVGIQAATLVASQKADIVITGGNFGPKASEIIQKTGAKMIGDVGDITIKEAIEKYKKIGGLQKGL